jgi:hypothetical protein
LGELFLEQKTLTLAQYPVYCKIISSSEVMKTIVLWRRYDEKDINQLIFCDPLGGVAFVPICAGSGGA